MITWEEASPLLVFKRTDIMMYTVSPSDCQ